MRIRTPLLVLSLLAAPVLAACGDNGFHPRTTPPQPRTIQVKAWGEGSGVIRAGDVIDCRYTQGQLTGTCTADVLSGTSLTFQAIPLDTASNGIPFDGWAGSCSGQVSTCFVQVDQFNLEVSAGFPGVTRLHGRIFRPGGEGGLGGLVVSMSVKDTLRGSVPVADDGSFDALLMGTWRSAPSLELAVDAVDPAARTYYPAYRSFEVFDLAEPVRWVVVPKEWAIAAGSFAGTRVPIDLRSVLAIEPAYYTTTGQSLAGREWQFQVQSVTADKLPMSLTVDRAGSTTAVSDTEVERYWRRIEELEAAVGRDLFVRVATAFEAQVVVRVRPGGCGRATACTNIFGGNPYLDRGAEVVHQSAEQFRGDRSIVHHELSHVLGMGHTCAWSSVMYPGTQECGGIGVSASGPTPADVAYIQLALAVNSRQKELGIDPYGGGIMAAWNGQRVLVDRLPPWLPPSCGLCGG